MANLSAIPPRFKAGFSGNVAGGAKCAIYGLHRRLRIGGASISLAGSKKMEIKYTRENGWEIWSTSSNYFLDFWSKAKTPGKSGMITGSTFTSHISRVDGVTLAGLETKTSWRPHLIRPRPLPRIHLLIPHRPLDPRRRLMRHTPHEDEPATEHGQHAQ